MILAITKIRYIGESLRTPGKYLRASIRYITKPSKTENGRYVGAISCLADSAYEDMLETKRMFGKEDKRQAYHIIISFNEGEITPDKALRFMYRFVSDYLQDEYECIFAVHTDTEHVHGHLIFNSVNKITGKKYRYKKGDWEAKIQPITDRLCMEFGLKTLSYDRDASKPERTYSHPGERKGQNMVWSEMIRRDVDAAILLESDIDGFLKNLEGRGYEIKQNKYISVRPPGMERYRRLATLGEDYTTDRILERLVRETMRTRKSVAPKILRVTIPYHLRRTKLSGLQRQYFRRLYETGKLKKRPYSQAWKYREEIRTFRRLQEDYLFLARNEIHSYEDLVEIRDRLERNSRKAGSKEIRAQLRLAKRIINETEQTDKNINMKRTEDKSWKKRIR